MPQYYFTVASLPMLFYGDESSPDIDTFLSTCRENCSTRDLSIIESATLTPKFDNAKSKSLIKDWESWETCLRNELILMRAKDRGRDAGKYVREEYSFYTEISDIAREAYSQESPLQAEEVLNQARWSRLEELETGHHFDLEKLIVYYLKLQLNERKARFSQANGEENFSRVYITVHESDTITESVAGEF